MLQVERGLTIFKSGEDVTVREKFKAGASGKREKSKANPREWGFTDNPWGKKARMWVGSTNRLEEDHWRKVIDDASAYIPASEQLAEWDGTEDDCDNEYEVDLRSCIELNWYLFYYYGRCMLKNWSQIPAGPHIVPLRVDPRHPAADPHVTRRS
jgi:hypothetical protein